MKRYGLLVVILVAALVAPTLVGAQGENLPGAGWWTGQQVQNIGTADATIISTAYDANSGATYMASQSPVAPGAAATFLPAAFVGMPNGFQGSAVVASDQPIKAIVTLTNRRSDPYGIDGGLAGGQYQGIDGTAAANVVMFPIVKNQFGPKTTTFFVQNAGSQDTTVHAKYVCGANVYEMDSAVIHLGQMVVLNPAAAGVPTGTACSATMDTTHAPGGTNQPIAGVAIEHYSSETVATLVQATRGFTPGDGATIIYAPIYKNQFPLHATQSRTAGAQVQNVSGALINNVHAVFVATNASTGAGCTVGTSYPADSGNIQPGASYTFLAPAGLPTGCAYSATFTSDGGNIVGIVNESYLNPAPPAGQQSSTAYNMMSGGGATTKVAAPLYKEKFGSKTSGLQVMNIGGSTANVHAIFNVGANSYTTVDYPIAPGASKTFYLMSDCGTACWVGGNAIPAASPAGVTVVSDGQNILAIVQEQTWTAAVTNCFGQGSITCYDRLNYEGFNVSP